MVKGDERVLEHTDRDGEHAGLGLTLGEQVAVVHGNVGPHAAVKVSNERTPRKAGPGEADEERPVAESGAR